MNELPHESAIPGHTRRAQDIAETLGEINGYVSMFDPVTPYRGMLDASFKLFTFYFSLN